MSYSVYYGKFLESEPSNYYIEDKDDTLTSNAGGRIFVFILFSHFLLLCSLLEVGCGKISTH